MRRRKFLTASTAMLVGLAGCLGDTEYNIDTASGETTIDPFTFEIRAIDREIRVENPGVIEVKIRNDGPALSVKNTGVWPLGVLGLKLTETDTPDHRILLHTDEYEQTSRVEVTETGVRVSNEPMVNTLAEGESITRKFQVRSADLYQGGTFQICNYFEDRLFKYRHKGEEEWTARKPDLRVEISTHSGLL